MGPVAPGGPNGLPDTVTLRLTPHPLAKDPEKFVADVKRRIRKFEKEKQEEVRGKGERFVGAKAVVDQNWHDTPNTTPDRRRLNPRFAEPDTERRVQKLPSFKAFLAEYDEARNLWMETGKATFPPGTKKMRNYPGVTVRAAVP